MTKRRSRDGSRLLAVALVVALTATMGAQANAQYVYQVQITPSGGQGLPKTVGNLTLYPSAINPHDFSTGVHTFDFLLSNQANVMYLSSGSFNYATNQELYSPHFVPTNMTSASFTVLSDKSMVLTTTLLNNNFVSSGETNSFCSSSGSSYYFGSPVKNMKAGSTVQLRLSGDFSKILSGTINVTENQVFGGATYYATFTGVRTR